MDRQNPSPENASSGAADGTGSLWRRLRQNAAENGSALREAGVHVDRVGQARCPRCGAAENLLFWTPGKRSRDSLRMRCPYCERGEVRYGISRNRIYAPGERVGAVRAVSWTVIAVSCMVAAAVWFQGPEISRVLGLALSSSVERAPVPAVRDGLRFPTVGRSGEVTSPLAGWWDRLRSQRAVPPAAAPVAFVAEGDRREEAQQLITAAGAEGAVRELRYVPDADGAAGATWLVLDAGAAALHDTLIQAEIWEREGAQ